MIYIKKYSLFSIISILLWSIPYITFGEELTTLKLGDGLEIEIIDNKMSKDDADRAFRYMKEYYYKSKKDYNKALDIIKKIRSYYGKDLDDDCILWEAKCKFYLPEPEHFIKIFDLLNQIQIMYPDGNIYDSREFVNTIKEFIANYGLTDRTWLDKKGGTVHWGDRPISGILLFYHFLKNVPSVNQIDLNETRGIVYKYLNNPYHDGIDRWLGAGQDAYHLPEPPAEFNVGRVLVDGVKQILLGKSNQSTMQTFVSEKLQFSEEFYGAIAHYVYKNNFYNYEYVWREDTDPRQYGLHVYSLFTDLVKSVEGVDRIPPILREIIESK